MSKIKFICFVILCCNVIACRKKELPKPATPMATVPAPIPTKGSINIVLNNVVGTQPLILDTSISYRLSNGDKFSVSTYNYYLSNFVFTDKNGNKYAEPESYHLAIASKPESLNFTIKDVPFANYISVEFLIGVDSIRNFSGAQVGALDPINAMIWSWSTGYIMAKMEGTSPQSSNANKSISYHIAGYKGEYKVLQKINLPLNTDAIVSNDKKTTIRLQSDLATWFGSFTFPGFSKLPSVSLEGMNAYNISQSYAAMMSVKDVENL